MFESRSPRSPFAQFLWRFLPASNGVYTHHATEYWSFFFKLEHGTTHVYVSGPATKPRKFTYVAGGEYWGVVLKAHVFMPSLAKKEILNTNLELPVVDDSFVFDKETFVIPSYETAESFMGQLVDSGKILASNIVADALGGKNYMAPRTIQRHVIQTTGITRQQTAGIRRAREAFILLQKGETIQGVIVLMGYVDQSHLTKSLRLLAGQTPAQILSAHKNKE
jgi:AraC-like DNA-binding protein